MIIHIRGECQVTILHSSLQKVSKFPGESTSFSDSWAKKKKIKTKRYWITEKYGKEKKYSSFFSFRTKSTNIIL